MYLAENKETKELSEFQWTDKISKDELTINGRFVDHNDYEIIEVDDMDLSIKITGEGTPIKIIESLRGLIESIQSTLLADHAVATFDGAEWEDSTLITEIKVK